MFIVKILEYVRFLFTSNSHLYFPPLLKVIYPLIMGFSGGSTVENLPTVQETQQEMPVQSLGGEDSLEKEMATHSSILVWEIPWTEEPSGLQSMGSQKVRHD